MARAVALLARREHSRGELGRKLRRWLDPEQGVDADALERVLDELQRQDLLSDARFAGALVRQRAQRYGDRRVADDLRKRGVTASDATAALATLHGTETARAQAVWSRRFDALPTSADERGRQGRYLQMRGFSMEAIRAVLSGKARDDG